MELENLKSLWQTISEDRIASERVDDQVLLQMVRRKSKTALDRIRTNLILEGVVGVLASLVMLWLCFYPGFSAEIKWINGFFLMIFSVFMVYFFKSLSLNLQLNTETGQLREGLKSIIIQLKSYLKLYRTINYQITPFAFIYGGWVGICLAEIHRGETDLIDPGNFMLWAYLAILAVLAIIGTYFTKKYINWWIKTLYEVHLQKLENALAELDE